MGHCFGCGEWATLWLNVNIMHLCLWRFLMKGLVGVGRDVGMSNSVVVMDEGTLSKHVTKMPYLEVVV